MKKTLTAILCLLLVAVMATALVACGEKEPEVKGPAKDVSLYNSGSGYDEVLDPLSWEAINKFPIVKDGMTIEEGRKLVVDFFRYVKTAVWMPSDNYEYKIKSANTDNESIAGFVKYGGLPYISLASGNIYRLMDYMDPETHVVDIATAGAKPTLFGNQCSFGSYVGIGRAINSAKYSWTKGMTPANGFIKVGDYTLDDTCQNFTNGGYNTITVLEENGPEKMYEAYTGLKAGDVIVYYTTAGHVVMISEDAVVERDANGKVDPVKSYVMVIDQTPGHAQMTNAAGDSFNYEKNVDAKWTFQKLFSGNYVPYTFAEWLGTDPLETSKTTYSHTGDTITMQQLCTSKVTSNYGITDVYASFYNAKGIEVYKMAIRAEETSVKELAIKGMGYNLDTWGSEDDLLADQEYTVKVYAQISTGERPTLWEGKFAR